jgi:hypothetical protein
MGGIGLARGRSSEQCVDEVFEAKVHGGLSPGARKGKREAHLGKALLA